MKSTSIHSDWLERYGDRLLSPYRKLRNTSYHSWGQTIGYMIGSILAPLGWLLQILSPSSRLSYKTAAWKVQFSTLSEDELNNIVHKMRPTKDPIIQALIDDIDLLNEIPLSTESPIKRTALTKFSIQAVEDMGARGKTYKERCKYHNINTDEFFVYRLFKDKLKRLQCKKAPGNISHEFKRRRKTASSSTHYKVSASEMGLFKRKISDLHKESLDAGRPYEETLRILEGTTWLTGTNSSILAMLPHTEMRLIPRGKLNADYGIAPLSGELTGGVFGNGMPMTSININKLSGATLKSMTMAWKYANSYHRNFEATMREDVITKEFKVGTDLLLAHQILQLRQWDEYLFQKLKPMHIGICYEASIQEIDSNISNLNTVIGLLQNLSSSTSVKEYTKEELERLEDNSSAAFNPYDDYYYFLAHTTVGPAIHRYPSAKLEDLLDKLTYLKQFHHDMFNEHCGRGWLPLLNRYKKQYENCRDVLLNAFNAERPRVILTDGDKAYVKKSFPIIFASSTLRSQQLRAGNGEYVVAATPKLGEDIDMMITDDAHVEICKQFLCEHQLEGKVEVHSMSRFDAIPVPLTESSDDITQFKPH